MTEGESKADWLRIYLELTDPDKRDERKRKTERESRVALAQADTGL